MWEDSPSTTHYYHASRSANPDLSLQMLEAIERINNFRAVKTQRHLRWSQSSHDQF